MKKGYIGVGFMLFFAILWVYFPLFTGNSILKWDATAIYLPWKRFICNAIFSENLPLWNPFMGLGFPQMMDVGTWYPISWIFGIGGYGLYSLSAEYLFHVWFGAMGIYFLLRYWKFDFLLSCVLAIVFLFNGFFIGNAQHVGWIVGAAWLPWIFWSFLRWESTFRSRNAGLLLVVFLGLQFTGGYPGLFVFTFYFLWFWYVVSRCKKIENRWVWESRIDWRNPFNTEMGTIAWWQIWLLFLAITMPAWVGLALNLGEITRAQGLGAADQNYGSFPSVGLIGVLNPEWFNHWIAKGNGSVSLAAAQTDISMMNAYLNGLLVISSMVVLFVGYRKNWFHESDRKFLLISGTIMLFFFLISMGGELPLRSGLNKILPGLGYFRFPALTRIFALIALLLFTAKLMQILINQWGSKSENKSIAVYVLLALIVQQSLTVAYSLRSTTVLTTKQNEYIEKSWIKQVEDQLDEKYLKGSTNNLITNKVVFADANVERKSSFLWYNRGVLDAVFSADGYNPYLLVSHKKWLSNPSNQPEISDSLRLFEVDSNQWKVGRIQVISNNEIDVELLQNKVDKSVFKQEDSIVSGQFNQNFHRGWKVQSNLTECVTFDLNETRDGVMQWKLLRNRNNYNISKLHLVFLFQPSLLVAGFPISFKLFVVLGASLFLGILIVLLLDGLFGIKMKN